MDLSDLKQHLHPIRPTKRYKRVNGKRVVQPPTPDEVANRISGLNVQGGATKRKPVTRSPTPSPLKKKQKPRKQESSQSSSSDFGKKKKRVVGLTPDQYTIATSTIPNAGNGAFANIYLPKGTVLGNYKGRRISKQQYERLADDSYVWELSSRYGPIYIDGKNQKISNWLRFLNDSRDKRINVEPYQYRSNIYYRTVKNINPGQEMFISYGDEYW